MKRKKNIRIREATLEDAEILAKTMREADVKELAATDTTPRQALIESLNASSIAWTAECEDGIICMWGVAPMTKGTGAVWLLGSDLVSTVRKTFMIETLEYIREMRNLFPTLINYVMVENEVSKRWLKWAGAEFGEPFDVNGHQFQPFVIGAYV